MSQFTVENALHHLPPLYRQAVEAERDRLREALERIAAPQRSDNLRSFGDVQAIARVALSLVEPRA